MLCFVPQLLDDLYPSFINQSQSLWQVPSKKIKKYDNRRSTKHQTEHRTTICNNINTGQSYIVILLYGSPKFMETVLSYIVMSWGVGVLTFVLLPVLQGEYCSVIKSIRSSIRPSECAHLRTIVCGQGSSHTQNALDDFQAAIYHNFQIMHC